MVYYTFRLVPWIIYPTLFNPFYGVYTLILAPLGRDRNHIYLHSNFCASLDDSSPFTLASLHLFVTQNGSWSSYLEDIKQRNFYFKTSHYKIQYCHTSASARIGEPDAPTNLSGLTISVNDLTELNFSRLQRFSIIGISFDNKVL
jgi:hypothetical protein